MELNWVTFALEIVNFLVLVWILQHFLYKPVLATIARRKAAIAKDLNEAENRRKQADALEQKFQQRIASWEKEKEALRAEAIAKIEDERKRRLAALQADLERESEQRRAVERRQAEEQRLKTEKEAAVRASSMATALLRRLASPALEERVVAVMVEDVGQLDGDRKRGLVDACRRADGKIEVVSAFPIGEQARRSLIDALEKATGQSVTANFRQDDSLVVGLRVAVGPLVLHANVADELTFFAEQLTHAH